MEEEHECVVKCALCGKDHPTGDKQCKQRYRTPFVLKQRQWRRQRSRSQKRDSSRRRRDRSVSFPRLPPVDSSSQKYNNEKSSKPQRHSRSKSKNRNPDSAEAAPLRQPCSTGTPDCTTQAAVSALFFAVLANAGNVGYGGGYVGAGGLGGLGGGFGGYVGGGYLGGGGRGYYGGGGRAYEDYRPKPYQFGYVAQGPDGSSSRQEVADGNGAVQGAYTITTSEGTQRKVKYAADAGGFRAVVDTNEPGTETSSPADAAFRSSQPPAAVLSAKYGPGAGARRVYGGAGYGGGLYRGAVGGYGGYGGVGGYGLGAGLGGYGGYGGGKYGGVVGGYGGVGAYGGHGWH
ncbi:uncharacterized protein LOC144152540 [Haemaphysalis longicornis]